MDTDCYHFIRPWATQVPYLDKTLPDMDAKGLFYMPYIVDWLRIPESYAQVLWFLQEEFNGEIRPNTWDYIEDIYNQYRQYFCWSHIFQLTRAYLPLLGIFDTGATSDCVTSAFYFDIDPMTNWEEMTPVINNNFADAPQLLVKNFIDFNFHMGGYYRYTTYKDLWDYVYDKGYAPHHHLYPDDMRKIYYDLKKWDKDIYSLRSMSAALWRSGDGLFNKTSADTAILNLGYQYTRNGGTLHSQSLAAKYGWQQTTFSLSQQFNYSSTTTDESGTEDPTGYAHYSYSAKDYWNIQNSEGKMYYYMPVPTTQYANLITSRKILLTFNVKHETAIYYSQSSQYTKNDTNYYVALFNFTKGDVKEFTDADGNELGLCQEWYINISDYKKVIENIMVMEDYENVKLRDYSVTRFSTADDYVVSYSDYLDIDLLGGYVSSKFHGSFAFPEDWTWQPETTTTTTTT